VRLVGRPLPANHWIACARRIHDNSAPNIPAAACGAQYRSPEDHPGGRGYRRGSETSPGTGRLWIRLEAIVAAVGAMIVCAVAQGRLAGHQPRGLD
ncbi:MAG TPA: hypothetical protein VMY37_00505, partial [Thermoguttaceae bacterium]|nr:hypothetical protein [Thermoguttaceae bacterium]